MIDVPARILSVTGSTCGLAVAALYLWCPVHRFPTATPFQGGRWYNPYAGVTTRTPWKKVNLHAHSRVWLGVTNGHGSADDVWRRYRALGYDAAPASNYQEISRPATLDPSALTVYEQGYNARKVHLLAIAPRRVDWLDYPLLQGRDEEQHRIDRLRASAGLVILAHPQLRHAISDADLRALTGYTAMEIASSHSRGEHAWNIALDAGRPVWGVASDDSHDIHSPNETGHYWTMVGAARTDAAAVQDALTAGRVYAVMSRYGQSEMALRSFSLTGDTLAVAFAGPPAILRLIGPGGRVVAEAVAADSARWVIPCDAAWVRVVARTPTMQILLQPLVRSETGGLPAVQASVALLPTYMRRTLAVVLGLLGVMGWVAAVAERGATESLGFRMPLRSAA